MTQSFSITLSVVKGRMIKDADLRIALAHMLAHAHSNRNIDLKRMRDNGYSYALEAFYMDMFLGHRTGLYNAFCAFQEMRDKEREYKRNKRASRARQYQRAGILEASHMRRSE